MVIGKTFTTTDLMEITGLTRAAVLKRAIPFGYTKYCKYVLKRTSWGNYIKEFLFTESQVKAMGCDHEIHPEVEKEQEEKDKEMKLEELKAAHPLVTDERCFVLNWFPKTVPSILEEDSIYSELG